MSQRTSLSAKHAESARLGSSRRPRVRERSAGVAQTGGDPVHRQQHGTVQVELWVLHLPTLCYCNASRVDTLFKLSWCRWFTV